MALPLGVRGSNPIWVLVNLAGKLFDDTYYMYVLENTIPYIPAPVFHYPDLSGPWTNPIQFLANGTLPSDIFFEPNKVYRLEFRQNNGLQSPSQMDPLIYEINDYIAGSGGSTPTTSFASSNQVTNPQFALINFSSPFSLTSATNPAPIEVGPGWFLELTGTGSLTMTQFPLDDDNINPSNAPYALRLQLSGWNSDGVILRQRFQQNGMLWARNFVSTTITTRVTGAFQSISARLVDSNNSLLATVLPATIVNESWNEFTGHDELPETTNPNVPPAAYIDYRLQLPNNTDIYITSIQLVVQENELEPGFEQDSIDRQIDHTFHYYKNPLLYKPIPSYLVGWDFPMNPAQLPWAGAYGSIPANAAGINKGYYAWDQTIIFQTVNSAVTVSRSNIPAMQVQAAVASTQFALIQYLEASKAMQIVLESFKNGLSVNVRCASTVAQNVTVSLWRTTNVSLPTLSDTLITTLDANGHPSGVVSGWTEIARSGQGNAQLTSGPSVVDYGFSGWKTALETDSQTTTFFAIVVGTNAITSGNVFQFSSISLVPGSVPTIPAPQTRDEVMRQCSRYYQKSFATIVSPAAAAGVVNVAFSQTQVQTASTSANGPTVVFPVEMRTTPAVALYNPVTAASSQIISTANVAWTSSLPANIGTKGFITTGTTPVGSSALQGASVHWTANAQLGVV